MILCPQYRMNTYGKTKPNYDIFEEKNRPYNLHILFKKEYCRMVKEAHAIFRTTRHSWSFRRNHDLFISFVKASEHRFHSPANALSFTSGCPSWTGCTTATEKLSSFSMPCGHAIIHSLNTGGEHSSGMLEKSNYFSLWEQQNLNFDLVDRYEIFVSQMTTDMFHLS